MSRRRRTVLNPGGGSLTFPMIASLLLHAAAFVSFWAVRGAMTLLLILFPWCGSEPTPMIRDTLEVEMLGSLPKSKHKMPDKPGRMLRDVGKQNDPKPEPPPVKESDLAFQTEEPEPDPGNVDEAKQQEELEDERRRQELLNELLDAPVAPRDRVPTDPDGTADEALAILTAGASGDPDYVRWRLRVRQMFQERFSPIGDFSGLTATGRITVDQNTGKILSRTLVKRSGKLGYDKAAERALAAQERIPLPPEKYRDLLSVPFDIEFALD